ncbi:hypothetical protein B484DRAFT_448236 [Ochromonadaceae sp. CCMP2298]|nr:hypothetical protein B484DRAFT_448236 [Ochromonadaceae sp. CCMP2298]
MARSWDVSPSQVTTARRVFISALNSAAEAKTSLSCENECSLSPSLLAAPDREAPYTAVWRLYSLSLCVTRSCPVRITQCVTTSTIASADCCSIELEVLGSRSRTISSGSSSSAGGKSASSSSITSASYSAAPVSTSAPPPITYPVPDPDLDLDPDPDPMPTPISTPPPTSPPSPIPIPTPTLPSLPAAAAAGSYRSCGGGGYRYCCCWCGGGGFLCCGVRDSLQIDSIRQQRSGGQSPG